MSRLRQYLRGTAVFIAVATVGLAAPSAALGAASWQPPVTLSPAGQSGFSPEVSVDPLGDAVAAWQSRDVEAATRPAGSCFASAQPVSDAGEANPYPQVALDAHGGAVLVWSHFDGSDGQLRVATRPPGGSFGAAETLLDAAGTDFFAQDVAVDAGGDAVVVWEGFDGSNGRIQAAVRPAGGSFGAAQTISPAGQNAGSPQVAVDPGGNAVVVWRRFDGSNDRVQAAVRPAGGSFGAAQTVSNAGETAYEPRVALDSHGNAVAVWESFSGSVVEVQAAFRPWGGSFGSPQPIPDPLPGSVANPGPSLGVDAQGDAVAAWSRGGGDGAHGTFDGHIQFALRPAGGGFGAAQTMPDGGADIGPQVAVDARGDAVVAWGAGVFGGSATAAEAALRPAGGSFGAPEPISEGSESVYHGEVSAAIDARGDAVAVWSRDGGAVRAATYGASPSTCPAAASPSLGPPALSRLALRPRRFRAARRGASVSTGVGTRVSYRLSEAAGVRFRIERVRPGRRVHGRCRRSTKRNRGHRRCTRYVRLRGSFTHQGGQGRNRFRFRGRLRHRRLRPGRYRLSARATDSAGRRSRLKRARFRIVRR